jgi:hypothetical protein
MRLELTATGRDIIDAMDEIARVRDFLEVNGSDVDGDDTIRLADRLTAALRTLGFDDSPPWSPTGPQTPDLPLGMQP